MGAILVVGSANYDLVWRSQRLPTPGETLLGDSFATFPGGKGANQAVAAGKLDADVHFCGCIGADSFGDELIASLHAANVKTECVKRVSAPTGNAAIIVDAKGANQIVVAPGANAELQPEDAIAAIERVRPDFVLAQLEIPLETVMAAASAAKCFLLNPAPARRLPQDLLSRCFALIPNETEMSALAGSTTRDFESLAPELFKSGVQNVVVTIGARGAIWLANDSREECKGHRVAVADTTAAGDVFCGALVARMAAGASIGEAIPFANAAAAISVTRHGAQASAPNREEVEALLA